MSDPGPSVAAVVQLLREGQFRREPEALLQEDMAAALTARWPATQREVITDAGRPDFLVHGIVVEVKIRGSRANLLRQVLRYADLEEVRAIIIATTMSRLITGIPNEIRGTPLHAAFLAGTVFG